MNFAEQLNAKKNLKAIDFAAEFLKKIKPVLVESAEKGYDTYVYKIDKNMDSGKEKLQLYSNPVFTEHLNKDLDGVDVTFEKDFVENVLFKGFGVTNYSLKFKW